MNPTPSRVRSFGDRAWQVLDIVLVMSTMALVAWMLDAATDLTESGLALIRLLILSTIPFLCALSARVIRAWLEKAERPWKRLVASGGILLAHPLIAGAVFLTSYCFDWALAARFALSRPALERAAHVAESRPDQTDETGRWIGLYRIEAVRIDPNGRVRFELGECSMFATCDLEYDKAIDCASRQWREYRQLDKHWCRVVHDHL